MRARPPDVHVWPVPPVVHLAPHPHHAGLRLPPPPPPLLLLLQRVAKRARPPTVSPAQISDEPPKPLYAFAALWV